MSITYQQEFVVKVLREIKPLLVEHWKEVALNQDTIALNPDWDAYLDLEEKGLLKVFTAREEGILVGYFVAICRNHIHYKDHLFAYNDVVYLKPEYRSTGVGPSLITFAENCLKDDGVSVLVVNTKRHKPFDSLLDRLGFTHIENIYSKLLR